MRKKISLLLLALICTLAFVGCASSESAEQDVDTMSDMSTSLVSVFDEMTDDVIEEYLETYEFDLDVLMYSNTIPADGETFLELISAWKTSLTDCGDFISLNSDFEAEVNGTEVTFTASAIYEERNAEIIFIYNDGRIESLTIDPVYSFNEIIVKAGLNTLLGMGTVFVILIFIAFIISLFKYIPMLEEKFKKKKEVPVATAPVQAVAPVVAPVTNVNADLDLIAVITAAIAASEGTTTDGFVVRSIKRRKSNKWNG
ncbi:MAG: OadG family protein [Eubacteriales bacterium]